MSEWSIIVRDLIAERRTTQYAICRVTNVHPTTLRRFLKSEIELRIDALESVLSHLGYHLTVFSKDGSSLICRQERRQSADAASPSRPVNDARVKSVATKNAKRGMTNIVHRLANVDTIRSGKKLAKNISPFIGHA